MNSLQKLLEWLANLVELLGMAWPFLLQGAMYTVLFAAVSMVLGLILGFSVAVVRVTKVPVVSQIAAVYVSAFRGTPLLVQIFVLYYGLPSVGIEFTPVTAGILALTLNVAAYLSESMRGAILGIDKGQWEAGLSVGLTWGQTLWNIITPQALRLAVPSLSNSLISLIKDTSLISVITVTELMLATKEVIAETFQPLPLYLAAALAAGDLRWRAGRRQASGDLRAKGDDPPLRMPAREQVERAMAATVVAHQVAQQATADQNLLHGCSTPLTGTQSSPPLADGHAR